MRFELDYSLEANEQLDELENNPSNKRECKAVQKALGYMETNIKHPSLNTHKYHSLKAHDGGDVFESYAQNKTPGAYRIFWHYGPGKQQITIISVLQHP